MSELRLYLDNLWLWKCNLPEKDMNPVPDLDRLKKSENPPEFEELRQYARNRMIMGRFRYGSVATQDFSKFDIVGEAFRRLGKYLSYHNLEHLADVENMICIEYLKAKRLGQRFTTIDDAEHAKPIR